MNSLYLLFDVLKFIHKKLKKEKKKPGTLANEAQTHDKKDIRLMFL